MERRATPVIVFSRTSVSLFLTEAWLITPRLPVSVGAIEMTPNLSVWHSKMWKLSWSFWMKASLPFNIMKQRINKFNKHRIRKNKCTFWLASSSWSLICSCCIWFSSSCWVCKRSCMSKGLLPLHSPVGLSEPRLSKPRPGFPCPRTSRSNSLWGRWRFRTKSNVNADPKESEREEEHMWELCKSSIYLQALEDKWVQTNVCVFPDEVSVRGSPLGERRPSPTPLSCCCWWCKTRCVCSQLDLTAD